MKPVEMVVGLLPKLTQKELKIAQAVIARLLVGEEAPREPPLFAHLCFGSGVKLPWHQFMKTTAYSSYTKHSPAFLGFISQHFPECDNSRIVMHAVTRHCATLLCDYLHSRRLPVTLGLLCKNLGRLTEAFDWAYPGYLKAGLSGLLLNELGVIRKP